MYKSVIVGYSRSPFTTAKKGELIDIKPVNLLAAVIKNLVSKSKVNTNDIEDIVIGCAFQVGDQCFNIGKLVTFLTGHPSSSDPPKISIQELAINTALAKTVFPGKHVAASILWTDEQQLEPVSHDMLEKWLS